MSYHALRYRTEKAAETAGFLRDECRAESQRQDGGLDLGEAGQMNVARLHQRRELGVKTLQLLRTYTAHQYSAVSTTTYTARVRPLTVTSELKDLQRPFERLFKDVSRTTVDTDKDIAVHC